mmetsp:Transcript_18848/g.71825  ORF Transcript_18848/g.71825 Transcript_18848/m.71825 type:complete len:240 (-) Transcript_18848:58-777(-)
MGLEATGKRQHAIRQHRSAGAGTGARAQRRRRHGARHDACGLLGGSGRSQGGCLACRHQSDQSPHAAAAALLCGACHRRVVQRGAEEHMAGNKHTDRITEARLVDGGVPAGVGPRETAPQPFHKRDDCARVAVNGRPVHRRVAKVVHSVQRRSSAGQLQYSGRVPCSCGKVEGESAPNVPKRHGIRRCGGDGGNNLCVPKNGRCMDRRQEQVVPGKRASVVGRACAANAHSACPASGGP